MLKMENEVFWRHTLLWWSDTLLIIKGFGYLNWEVEVDVLLDDVLSSNNVMILLSYNLIDCTIFIAVYSAWH
jgi:hypothetical protein